ncbi:hypothetical protein ES707_21350 [subsurface metagenome]
MLSTCVFTEYFNHHYFFTEKAQIAEYQTQLEAFKRRVGFPLPNEGEIVFDDSESYHFMSFNYVDLNKDLGRLLKGKVSFLRVSVYCGECHQLKRLYFSVDNLKVHNQRGDEHHYLCYHEKGHSFMFFVKPDFTRLRHIKKRSGKTVDLSNSREDLVPYQPNRVHVVKQKSKFKYKPPKIYRGVEIVSLGRVYEAGVLRFAYKKKSWFSQEQLINHLISKRELTQDFHSLSDSDKNYNFRNYNDAVSWVVDRLSRKGWVCFSLVPQMGAQKRCSLKSVQITEEGKKFWGYLVREYGAKGLLSSQFDLVSAYKKFMGPQTLSGSGSGICIVVVLFAGFVAFLLVMDFLSSFL